VLSPEIQRIVIRLSEILTRDQIATYTGVSTPAIHKIHNYFDKYETTKQVRMRRRKGRGRRGKGI
jgi:hypothetical protein